MNTRRRHFLLLSVAGALIISGISGSISAVFLNSKNTSVEAASSTRYPITTPTEYYSSISSNSSTLLNDLNKLNSSKKKATVGYSAMLSSPENGFYVTDPGATKGSTITTFYSGKSNNGTSGLNREHVWPDSRGGNLVEGDIHMPRPTLNAENGSRGNSFYVEGKCKPSGGWDPAMESFGLESYRGDSARIIFYCAIANTQLTLVDKEDDSTGNKTMGKLSDLLKWNLEYPVLDREKVRNDGAESLQGNRNPFIDHPEYACKIWGNTNSATKAICAAQESKTLSSLSVSGNPTTNIYREGESFDSTGLIVTATYSNGSTENVTSSIVWTPTPLTTGTTSVIGKYTYEGVTKQVTVSGITVYDASTPISVTGISLSDTSISIYKDETKTLTATITPSIATNKTVYWSSDNVSVASVSNGVVRGVSKGNAVITAKTADGNKTAICSVTVSDAPVISSITFGREDFTGSGSYSWYPWSKSGISGKGFIYASEKNKIQMNTSKKTYSIYSSATVGKSIKSITVKSQSGSPKLVVRGKTTAFTEDDWKTGGTSFGEKQATTSGTTWDFTGNNQYFSVNLAEGNGVGYLSEITVNYDSSTTPEVKSLSLDKTNISLSMSGTKTATLTPTVTADSGANTTVYWNSSDESIVSLSKAFGTKDESVTLTANQAGSAVITAICGSKTTTCNVSVESGTISVTSVSLNKTEENMLVGGTDLTLSATVLPSDATNRNVNWSSSNDSVATVSNNGVVHAVSDGTAIITVTTVDGNKTATCTVHVSTPSVIVPVTGVSLNLSTKTLNEGGSFTLAATVAPSDATNKDVTWASNNEDVATVSNGVVSALSAGTTQITVTTVDGGFNASCEVTVNSVTPPTPIDEKVMTELVIDKLPDKMIYQVGEEFNQTGLEVSVNYLDGSSAKVTDFFIPNKPKSSIAGSQTVKIYYNEFGKNVIASFDVLYIEASQTINEIKLDGELLKTEYFVGDELLLYGFDVKATLSDGTVVDATDLVEITYDLSTPGIAVVTVSLDGVSSVTFDVTVKEGVPSAKDEAVDFTYEYLEKIPEEVDQVTKAEWLMLEHYFNTLDEDAQAVLRNYGTDYGGVKAGAEDNLLEVLTSYDEVILAKKSQGFSDFMGRNPQSHADEKPSIKLLPIIIVGVAVIVLTAGLIILLVAVAKKKRKLAN